MVVLVVAYVVVCLWLFREVVKDYRRACAQAAELGRRAEPFPPSIFDRRNPLHPLGTPVVRREVRR